MRRHLYLAISFSILISFCNFYNVEAYTKSNLILVNFTSEESNYIDELQRIQNALFTASTEALENSPNETHINDLNKELMYIKSQIKSMRIKLNDYHKKQSLDIDKNPISLGLLNTLNYYSMSLSALEGFVNTNDVSDKNRYLENYFFAKVSATQTLDWVKDALGYDN